MFNSIFKKMKSSKEVINASWLIISRVIQVIISFLLSVFTARYLGPSDYGVINYSIAYVAFFSSLCTLGINSILVKEFVDDKENHGTIIGTTILLRLLSSFLSLIMIISIVCIVDRDEPSTIIVTFLCSLSLIFQSLDTINYWFQYKYQSKIVAVSILIAYIITSIYKTVILIYNKSVFWFAFASTIDSIFVSIFLFIFYKRNDGPPLKFSFQKSKELLSKSYHYILSGMMVAIYTQTDKFMIKQMMNSADVGYYSLASSINGMWVFVLSAIIDSIFPTIMRLNNNSSEEDFNKKNRQLYAMVIYISLFVSICLVIFGKPFIRIIYGEEYSPAAGILNIIAWYTMFSYLGVARNAWIVCKNCQKYLKYMYFGAALINVFLNYLLIPIIGSYGAALASLITQICTSLILPCFIKDLRPNVKLMIEAFLLKDIK